MKPFKTAGILALVLLALGGLATWDEWKTKKDEKAKDSENRLADFDVSKITHLEFENSGNDIVDGETAPAQLSLKADLSNGVWTIRKPIVAPGDSKAIANLIATIKDYKYEKVAADTLAESSKYGVDKPRRRVMVYEGDKLVADVMVGSNAPVGYHVYSSVKGRDQVLIGSQYLAVATNKSLFDLRDKVLVKVKVDTLSSFTLRSFNSNLFSITKSDQKFLIATPEPSDADSLAVKNFFEDLERATVVEVIDEPGPDLLKAVNVATEASLNWTLADGSVGTLRAVEIGKDIFCRLGDGNTLYRMSPEFKKKFSQTSSDFRDRRVFQFSSSEVYSVDINGKKFKKIGDDWFDSQGVEKFAGSEKYSGPPENRPESIGYIRSLVVDLEYLRALDFLTSTQVEKNVGTVAPTHQLKLEFGEGSLKEPIIVDLWPETVARESGEKEWVLRNSVNQRVYRISSNLIQTLTNKKSSQAKTENPAPAGLVEPTDWDVALPEAMDDGPDKDLSGMKN